MSNSIDVYRCAEQRNVGQLVVCVDQVPPRVYAIDAMAEMFAKCDARIVGPDASDYEFQEAIADGADVSNIFVTASGNRAHFHLAVLRPSLEKEGYVRALFRSTRNGALLTASSTFQVNDDRTLTVPSGETTSCGGVYSGPAIHSAMIEFARDRFVHLGEPTSDPARIQGSPARASFACVGFYTWLDTAADGMVENAPLATASGGTIDVLYAVGSGAREARLNYDPRDARGRLVLGRHSITVCWRITKKRRPIELAAAVEVLVSDDGAIAVGV